jgi:biotin synthase
MKGQDLIKKSMAGEDLKAEEIAELFKVPLFSDEAALIQVASYRKSKIASDNLAEVHAQIGLNIAPCPKNCLFCAFAAANGVFKERSELPLGEVLERAQGFEADGANAVFLMSTADYPFTKFLETGQEVRKALRPETRLVANVGDFTLEEAKRIKAAGFCGVYHALRLGEGRDSRLRPEQRLETFSHAREAGLLLGTCLEPVGNEHTIDELVEKTIITRQARPVFSGTARRIPIPNTKLSEYGWVSEARMAHILAVVRLALGYTIPGNCTHEPNVIGAVAGANLFWAEVGSNPRDTKEETKEARGMSVGDCRRLLEEAEWKVLSGPSMFYSEDRKKIIDSKIQVNCESAL